MAQLSLKQRFVHIHEEFVSGKIDRYQYLSERHEFNKLLLEYANHIKNTDIESIKILPDSVILSFKPMGIELETEGSARSAPFEILNFGHYEPEDETLVYQLIRNRNTILDLGANLGWYTINLAKRCPTAKIYGFEPVLPTYQLLGRNIERNKLNNVTVFNFGLSNKEEERSLFYFKGGSSIASIANVIDNPNAKKVSCRFRTLDAVIEEQKLTSVDFIKCDIEGWEVPALQGGYKTIEKFKPILLVEVYEEFCQKCGFSANDIIELLSGLGYQIFEAIKGKLIRRKEVRTKDDGSGRYNYFFLHPEKHRKSIAQWS